MNSALHTFGDYRPLPPSPTGQYWRVETPEGHYIATFATEAAARAHVATLSKAYRDYRIAPVFIVKG